MGSDRQTSIAKPADGVECIDPDGSGPFLLICEHASKRIPAAYGTLGLSQEALESHIAWDPGARAVALGLSARLRAPLVASTVSRLVYDCNRPPDDPTAMPARSEIYDIPGNASLSPDDRAARARRVYAPFRDAVDATIDGRLARGIDTALVTVHSFTPVYHGRPRSVEVGVIHDADAALADALLDLVAGGHRLRFARNEPYTAADGVTHTLKRFGVARGLPNVMLEIRNDLIATPEAQERMAEDLAGLLTAAAVRCNLASPTRTEGKATNG